MREIGENKLDVCAERRLQGVFRTRARQSVIAGEKVPSFGLKFMSCNVLRTRPKRQQNMRMILPLAKPFAILIVMVSSRMI